MGEDYIAILRFLSKEIDAARRWLLTRGLRMNGSLASRLGTTLASPGGLVWIHLDLRHHAAIFMVQDVTVIDEGSHDVRIAEIHADGDAGIWACAAPRRDRHGIEQVLICHRNAIHGHHQ